MLVDQFELFEQKLKIIIKFIFRVLFKEIFAIIVRSTVSLCLYCLKSESDKAYQVNTNP
jgi:hypothetical protein